VSCETRLDTLLTSLKTQLVCWHYVVDCGWLVSFRFSIDVSRVRSSVAWWVLVARPTRGSGDSVCECTSPIVFYLCRRQKNDKKTINCDKKIETTRKAQLRPRWEFVCRTRNDCLITDPLPDSRQSISLCLDYWCVLVYGNDLQKSSMLKTQ